jgi:hypothetical protein
MAQDVPFLRLDDGLSLPAFNEQEHNVWVSHKCGLLLRVWPYVHDAVAASLRSPGRNVNRLRLAALLILPFQEYRAQPAGSSSNTEMNKLT